MRDFSIFKTDNDLSVETFRKEFLKEGNYLMHY